MPTGVMSAEDTFQVQTSYFGTAIGIGGGGGSVYQTNGQPFAAAPPKKGSPFEIMQVRFEGLTGVNGDTEIKFYFQRLAGGVPFSDEYSAPINPTEEVAVYTFDPPLWHIIRRDDVTTAGENDTIYLNCKSANDTISTVMALVFWRQE